MTCFTDNCIHLKKLVIVKRKSKIKSIIGLHSILRAAVVKVIQQVSLSFQLNIGNANGHQFPGTDQQ